MKRLPKVLAAFALGGCSAPPHIPDPADAAIADAGRDDYDAGHGTAWGDAGCVLPSDFPWDADYADVIAEAACQCVYVPELFHCFEENGPRCFSWACPPAVDRNDG